MSDKLHTAICQVVAIMNRTIMEDIELINAHDILRVALIDYADEPVNAYDAALQERMLVLERQRDEATSKLFQMTKERDRYRRTLARIAEGDRTPMLVARAVLDGAEWNVK